MELNLLRNYPKANRDLSERSAAKTEEDRSIARRFGKDFFDGDRRHGYGGYNYNPRFWSKVVLDILCHYKFDGRESIFDVGCGKGFMLYDFSLAMPTLNLSGIDISEYAINNAHPPVKNLVSVGKAEDLDHIEDNTYDLTISINTVHNLELDSCIKALKDIDRISKNAFITVDAWRTDEERQRMMDWNLTAKTMMSVYNWIEMFNDIGYTKDYYWFIP